MTDKVIPGAWLRDYAELFRAYQADPEFGGRWCEYLFDEAARREAGDGGCKRCGGTFYAGCTLPDCGKPDAPPPPGDDSYIHLVPHKCDRIVWRGSYYHLPLNAAAIEALRARVAALEGSLKAIRDHKLTNSTEPQSLAFDRLRICTGIADQALAAGGTNG